MGDDHEETGKNSRSECITRVLAVRQAAYVNRYTTKRAMKNATARKHTTTGTPTTPVLPPTPRTREKPTTPSIPPHGIIPTVEKTVPRREELVGNSKVSQVLLHQLVNAGQEGAELGCRDPVVHGIVVVIDNSSQGVPQVVN